MLNLSNGRVDPREHRQGAPDFTKRPPPFPYKVNRLIRRTAMEFAGAFYEGNQKFTPMPIVDNHEKPIGEHRTKTFREHFPTEASYVAWCWPMYVREARKYLTRLLAKPTTAQYLKDEIEDALLADYDDMAFNEHVVGQLIRSNALEHQRKQAQRRANAGR